MPLDARDLLAGVIPLAISRIGVLYALCIHDQEGWLGVAPPFLAGRANLIFLRPVPGRSCRADPARSILQSTNAPSSIWENPSATSATATTPQQIQHRTQHFV